MAGLLSPNTWLEWGRREKEWKRKRVNASEWKGKWRKGGEAAEVLQKKKKAKMRLSKTEPGNSSLWRQAYCTQGYLSNNAAFAWKNPLLSRINEDGTLFLHRKPCRKKESAMNSRRKHRWRNTLIRHQNHAWTKHCSPKYSAKAFCQFHRKK